MIARCFQMLAPNTKIVRIQSIGWDVVFSNDLPSLFIHIQFEKEEIILESFFSLRSWYEIHFVVAEHLEDTVDGCNYIFLSGDFTTTAQITNDKMF